MSRRGWRHPAVQVALLSLAELLGMTLWFSATAVAPSLQEAWSLSDAATAGLTAAVQLGFVAGALLSAFFNLPDLVSPRRLFAAAAVLGAGANLLLAWTVTDAGPALVLRFVTGMCLAGVYPPGMKIAAGHVSGRARGRVIGVLVGALTLGSATPHLVAGVLAGQDPAHVLAASSGLALAGAVVVLALVRDGPHAPPSAPFDPRQVPRVVRNRPLVLATLGYCGHMWELYALWTWLATFLTAGVAVGAEVPVRGLAFTTIGVAGVVGAVAGGVVADRWGRTATTTAAMALSGACCLASPLLFGAGAVALVLFGVLWGATVIADSAQFSAAATELAEPGYVGTALTLQTAVGFALTMVTIRGLPWVAGVVGWRWAFVVLAPGPLLGCVAMLRLRARPEARRLAGGRR